MLLQLIYNCLLLLLSSPETQLYGHSEDIICSTWNNPKEKTEIHYISAIEHLTALHNNPLRWVRERGNNILILSLDQSAASNDAWYRMYSPCFNYFIKHS